MPTIDELLAQYDNNSVIQQYRATEAGRNDPRSNLELTEIIGDQLRASGNYEVEERFPDFRNQYLNIKNSKRGGVVEEFGKGFSSGVEGLKATAKGALALGADLIPGEDGAVDKYIRDPLLRSAQQDMQEASEGGPVVSRWEDARTFGEKLSYLAGGTGQVVPSVGESLGAGLAGGGIGGLATKNLIKGGVKEFLKNRVKAKAKGELTKEALEKGVTSLSAQYGSTGLIALNSYGLSSGEIYNDLKSDPEIDDDTARLTALTFGGMAALPDTVLPAYVIGKFWGKPLAKLTQTEKKVAKNYFQKFAEATDRNFGTRFLREGIKTAPTEAGTEALQEYLNIAASKFAKGEPPTLTDEDKSRLLNAGILGALGGGVAAPIAAIPRSTPSTQPEPSTTPDETAPSVDSDTEPTSESDQPPAQTAQRKRADLADILNKSREKTVGASAQEEAAAQIEEALGGGAPAPVPAVSPVTQPQPQAVAPVSPVEPPVDQSEPEQASTPEPNVQTADEETTIPEQPQGQAVQTQEEIAEPPAQDLPEGEEGVDWVRDGAPIPEGKEPYLYLDGFAYLTDADPITPEIEPESEAPAMSIDEGVGVIQSYNPTQWLDDVDKALEAYSGRTSKSNKKKKKNEDGSVEVIEDAKVGRKATRIAGVFLHDDGTVSVRGLRREGKKTMVHGKPGQKTKAGKERKKTDQNITAVDGQIQGAFILKEPSESIYHEGIPAESWVKASAGNITSDVSVPGRGQSQLLKKITEGDLIAILKDQGIDASAFPSSAIKEVAAGGVPLIPPAGDNITQEQVDESVKALNAAVERISNKDYPRRKAESDLITLSFYRRESIESPRGISLDAGGVEEREARRAAREGFDEEQYEADLAESGRGSLMAEEEWSLQSPLDDGGIIGDGQINKEGDNNRIQDEEAIEDQFSYERLAAAEARINEASTQSYLARGNRAATTTSRGQPRQQKELIEEGRSEEQKLKRFAEANNLLIPWEAFQNRLDAFNNAGGLNTSTEQEVYFDGQSWFKRGPAIGDNGKRLGAHYTWSEFFARIAIHRELFPDTAYDFLGFTVNPDGKLNYIIRQPHAQRGERVDVKPMLVEELEQSGYESLDGDAYYNPENGVVVQDLHDKNAFIDYDGQLAVIDPVINLAAPWMFKKGSLLSLEEQPDQFPQPTDFFYTEESEWQSEPSVSPLAPPATPSDAINPNEQARYDYATGTFVKPQRRMASPAAIDAMLEEVNAPKISQANFLTDELASTFKPSKRGIKATSRLFSMLNDAANRAGSPEAFESMRLIVSDQVPANFQASPRNRGAYNPATNELWINSAHAGNAGDGFFLTLVHEAGHMFVNHIMGRESAMTEWANLTDKQRAESWKQYLDASGVRRKLSDIDGALLLFDETAMQEWAAFQFTRIIRNGEQNLNTTRKEMSAEGMTKPFIDKIIDWFKTVRTLVKDWIGDARLSTKKLDETMQVILGLREGDVEQNLSDIAGTSLQSPITQSLQSPATDGERRARLLVNPTGYVDPSAMFSDAYAIGNELKVYEKVYAEVAKISKRYADKGFDKWAREFLDNPATGQQIEDHLDNKGIQYDKEVYDDITNADRRRRIAFHTSVEHHHNSLKASKKIADAQRNLDTDSRKLERKKQSLESKIKEFADIEKLSAVAAGDLRALVNDMATAINSHGVASKHLGKLAESIRSLEGKNFTAKVVNNYIKAFNKILKDASGNPVDFYDTIASFSKALELGISLDQPAAEIKAQMAQSGNAKVRKATTLNNPTFAAMAALAKADRHLFDTIILRTIPDLKERAAITQAELSAIRGDMAAAKKATQEAQKRVKEYSALYGRLQNEREAIQKEVNRLTRSVSKSKEDIEAFTLIQKVSSRLMNDMIAEYGGTIKGNIEQGTKILDPKTPDASPEDIMGNAQAFSWKDGQVLPTAEWRNIIRRMDEWISNTDNAAENPFFYNAVVTQREHMVRIAADKSTFESKQFAMTKWYPKPLATIMKNTGTAEGRRLAQQATTWQALMEKWKNEAGRFGRTSDRLRNEIINLSGFADSVSAQSDFTELFDTPAKYHLEQTGATYESMFKMFQAIPGHERYINEKTRPLIRQYLDNEKAFASWLKDRISEAGVRVTDDRLSVIDPTTGKFTPIERLHLNLGTGNFMVRPRSVMISRIVENMAPLEGETRTLWADDEVFKQLEADPSIAPDVATALTDNAIIIDEFIEPLVQKDKTPAFLLPEDANGDTEFANRETLIAAWEESGKEFEPFLRLVYQSVQTSEPYESFVAKNLEHLRNTYFNSLLADHLHELSVKNNGYMPDHAQHAAIDARKADLYPAQWIQYRQGTSTGNVNLANSAAFHAAFGKDGVEWRDTIQRLIERYDVLIDGLDQVKRQTQKWMSQNPTATKKQIQAKMVEFAGGKEQLAEMRSARDDKTRVQKANQGFNSLHQSDLAPTQDEGTVMELMSLMVKGILNGLRASLVQFSQLYYSFLHYGVGKESFRQIGSAIKYTAQDVIGSFFQAFGYVMDNESFRRQAELYGADADIGNPFLKTILADYGAQGELRDGTIQSRARRALRIMNNLMSQGYSKASAEQAIYTSFKPWAIFSQFIGALNKSAMLSTRDTFNRLGVKAMEYMNSHPEAFNDAEFEFTPEMLGYTGQDKKAFEKMVAILTMDVGTDLESVARDAITSNRDRPFTDMQESMISTVGLSIIASESNWMLTRSFWMKDGIGKYLFPLLGWSMQAPNLFGQMFKTAKGDITKDSLLSGIVTLGFAVLPATMAFSLFVDWFDEEIVGKKNGFTPLFNKETWSQSIVERWTRYGPMGLPAEVINGMINLGAEGGDVRALSLDQRVMLASSLNNMRRAIGAWYNQGEATWSTVGRPFFQSFGGNGLLQQIDIFQNVTGMELMQDEARIIQRINANNYIRTAGRGLGIEVRAGGGYYATPTKMTPWVTQMYLAAIGNDAQEFRKSYMRALEAAREMGKADPQDSVKRSFQGRHPLKTIFKTSLSSGEYQKILSTLNDRGKRDVSQAVNLINRYGQTIGIDPYYGKQPKARKAASTGMAVSRNDFMGY